MTRFTLFFAALLLAIAGTSRAQITGSYTPQGVKPLDSIYGYTWYTQDNTWKNFSRTTKTPDNLGRIALSREIVYDTVKSKWRNSKQDIYTYSGPGTDYVTLSSQVWSTAHADWYTSQYTHRSSKGLVDTTFTKNWSEKLQRFITGSRYINEYNGDGNLSQQIRQMLDTVSTSWLNISLEAFTYTGGQITERLDKSWNLMGQTWINFRKIDNTYDSLARMTLQLVYYWNDSVTDWNNSQRITFSNYLAGGPQLTLAEFWNPETSAWYNSYKITDVYTPNNLKMNEMKFEFDTVTQQWVNNYLTYWTFYDVTLTKDENGQYWDTINRHWIADRYILWDRQSRIIDQQLKTHNVINFLVTGGDETLTVYDSLTGKVAETTEKNWSVADSAWENAVRDSYTYDDQRNLTQQITDTWESSAWVHNKRYDYFYGFPFGIDEVKRSARPCFYRNPLTAGDAIDCPLLAPGQVYKYALFSLSGRNILNGSFSGGSSFILDQNLATGIYVLRIDGNGGVVWMDKVVIVR
jgi:hypothetical protein